MGPMQAIMSGVITIFFYALVIAVVWKVFQMATDLSEIKVLLTDLRKTAPPAAMKPVPPPVAAVAPPIMTGPISLESAEALLREVEAESHALASEPSHK